MNFRYKNKLKVLTALLLLGFYVLSFLHSELGFLDFDNDNHGSHDFCEIVKNTNSQIKSIKEEIPKPELNGYLIFNIDIENKLKLPAVNTFIETNLFIKDTSDLYLQNSIFQI